jgi:hypothetical protein
MGGSADLRNAFPGNFGLSVSLGPFVLATRRSKTGHFGVSPLGTRKVNIHRYRHLLCCTTLGSGPTNLNRGWAAPARPSTWRGRF